MALTRLGTVMLFVVSAASGCTLWAGGKLSDKPSEAGTGGEGGEGNQGGSAGSGGVMTTSTSTSTSSSSSSSSSSSGAMQCPKDTADCDGMAMNGCEAKLKTDNMHCGKCEEACKPGKHCEDGHCK